MHKTDMVTEARDVLKAIKRGDCDYAVQLLAQQAFQAGRVTSELRSTDPQRWEASRERWPEKESLQRLFAVTMAAVRKKCVKKLKPPRR